MSVADVVGMLLHEYALVNGRINQLVAPWDDARLADQPQGQVNHPAWTLGHLCTVMDNGCAMLGGKNEINEAWTKLFGGGSKPTTRRADYPTKQELLTRYNALAERFAEHVRKAPVALLTAENPRERSRSRFPRTGDLVIHMLTAEPGYHLGQMTGWCRAMGWEVMF